MSSLIYFLVLLKNSLLCALFFVPLFTLSGYNNNCNYNCLSDTTNRYSAYNRNCFVYTELVTRLLRLQLTDRSLYPALLLVQSNTFSLQNVLEDSCSCLLDKFAATVCICAFSYMREILFILVGLGGIYLCWCICVIAYYSCCYSLYCSVFAF